MILERLTLENFRQFRGRQELVFSDLQNKNITIVHAENGFGKTTLLKGILWVLYGRDGLMGTDGKPDDFEKPDRIINEILEAKAGDPKEVKASVEVIFKHDEVRYILRRSISLAQQKLDPKKSDLSLELMRDGQTYKQDNPQKRIQAIVPSGIRKLLLFNGERINYLAMEQNSKEVSDAIHQMLGLRLLQTTVDDLGHQNVRGKLVQDLKEQPTSDEKKLLLGDRETAEELLHSLTEEQSQANRNLDALAKEVELIDNKLAANRGARELQAKRIRLQKELDQLVLKKQEQQKRLGKLISDRGYSLFTRDLVSQGKKLVSDMRSDNLIPAKVLNSFLKDLLESESCICKRHLSLGSPEREAVEQLLTVAGDQDFNNAVGSLDNAMGILEGLQVEVAEQVQNLNRELLEAQREIRDRDEAIEQIHQEIGDQDDDEVRALEDKRKSLILERDSLNSNSGRLGAEITTQEEEIKRLSSEIGQVKEADERARLAQRRVTAVEEAADVLKKILEAETQELRPLLNDEIASHFKKIIVRDYRAELTEDYTLRVRKTVAGTTDAQGGETEIDAALSTGQRTVASLVFIASLVALAKRRSEIPTILKGLTGATYPVVIDSPFGSLSTFRKDVAKYIPELAPQVLLLVSPSQYEGDVEQALEEGGRVGKRYYLSFNGKTMPERAKSELKINGETFQQYHQNDEDEYTEIIEISS